MNTRPHTQLCKKCQSSASLKISFLILSPAPLCSQEIPTAAEKLPHRSSLIHHNPPLHLRVLRPQKLSECVTSSLRSTEEDCQSSVSVIIMFRHFLWFSKLKHSQLLLLFHIWQQSANFNPMVYLDHLFIIGGIFLSKPSSRHAWHFSSAAIKSEKFLESGG